MKKDNEDIMNHRLSVVLLTFNEEANLPACLESLKELNSELFIVDSGSTDRTREIATRFGAAITEHPFETHAKQWDWVLRNLPISTEWVLAIDADQRLTPELRAEISDFLKNRARANGDLGGCYIKRRQIFRGKWIKHGGYYPKYLLKLFRRDQAWSDQTDLVDHHFRVKGKVAKLQNDLVEDNRNEADIRIWIEKHNRYAVLQAREEISRTINGNGRLSIRALFGTPDERVLWRKRVWSKLPLYVRPALYFFYRYILRLGFLDGKQGFIFHFMQAFWYRLLVDINRDELRKIQFTGDKVKTQLVRCIREFEE